ncbi:MAG: GNAT family N-acetyltransferase, partial [Solirubrobacterales bacterium]
EAEHNLILGLSSSLHRQPQLYGEDPYLAVVEDGSLVVAAALRTPPHNIVLSEMDDLGAIEALAADVHEVFEALPGLLAPSRVAARFASAWEKATGARGHRVLAERAFRAERVIPPRPVEGRMRPYRDLDRELAVRWLDAFTAEALPEPPPESSPRWLDRRLADPEGSVVLWEDGEPVSLAAAGGTTPNGIRIGPVYTPPELRGRGYASALVAELTRVQLEGGRRFCFLFTDLANPTSNRIYQRVGYEPVTDVDQWSFA